MKRVIPLIILNLLIVFISYSQTAVSKYTDAMKHYYAGDYSIAIKLFLELEGSEELNNKLLSSAKFYTGESFIALEQFDGAISTFEEFVSSFPTSNFRDAVLYRLGKLYFEKKLYEESRKYLVELVSEFEKSEYNGSAYHLIGQSFIEEDNFTKAEEFFSSAVTSKRNNDFVDQSIFALANLYEKQEEYKKAVENYDKLLGYHRNSKLAPLAQLRIGICYYQMGEYDSAVLELSDPLIQKLNIDQQNDADYVLANTFYKLREYENATETYRRILKNSPTSDMLDKIRYGIAWIHFQRKNYNDAFKMFTLLSDSQNDSIALKSLYWSAESKRYEGKYGEAIEIHKTFVEKYPDHPFTEKVRLNIGISKFSSKSFSESEESLLASTDSSDPLTKAKSFTLLGELYLIKKNYRTAEEFFDRGLLVPGITQELKDRCNLGLGVSKYFTKNYIPALQNLSEINAADTKIELDKYYFYLAEVNFYLGNYSISINNYNKVVTNNVEIQKNVLYGTAYSHFNEKDFNKAAFYFNDYLKRFERDEKSEECKLRLADCYYATKTYGRASELYDEVLVNGSKYRNDERSFFNYAQSLFKQGSSIKAINILEEIQLKFPASKYADDSQYLIGWINFQNSNFDEAINGYTKLISNYPSSVLLPIAYYSIGDSYFNMGQYQESIDSYKLVISEFPNSSYVYDAVNGIQYCYIVQDEQDRAIEYLNEFISGNENSPFLDKVQFKKGEIYYSSGEYSQALNEYKILVNDYSNSELVPSAYFWMGKSSILLNKYEEAKDYFQTVFDYSINSEIGFSAVLELGKIYRSQNELGKEIELYDEVLAEITGAKKVSELKFVKAQNYILQEDLGSAYQILNEIVNLRDGSLFYHKAEIELAILELARSNYESSLYLLRDVADNREDDIAAQAQYYIGLNYFNQEKLAEAITELKKARALYSAYNEWYVKSIMLLGDCYVKIDDKASATEMYKAVLKRHRNDEIAKEANDKLNQL